MVVTLVLVHSLHASTETFDQVSVLAQVFFLLLSRCDSEWTVCTVLSFHCFTFLIMFDYQIYCHSGHSFLLEIFACLTLLTLVIIEWTTHFVNSSLFFVLASTFFNLEPRIMEIMFDTAAFESHTPKLNFENESFVDGIQLRVLYPSLWNFLYYINMKEGGTSKAPVDWGKEGGRYILPIHVFK